MVPDNFDTNVNVAKNMSTEKDQPASNACKAIGY